MVALKLRKIGNSVGIILPQATLDVLRVDEGDHGLFDLVCRGIPTHPL